MNGSLMALMLVRALPCAARVTSRPIRPKPLIPTLIGPAVLALASEALTMLMNSGLSDAPPTRKPSMSALPASSEGGRGGREGGREA